MKVCTTKGYRTITGSESYQGNRRKSLNAELLRARLGADVVIFKNLPFAGMAELADATDSKSVDLRVMGVRPPLPAPLVQKQLLPLLRMLDCCRRLEGVHSRLSSLLAVLFLALSSTAQTPQPATAEKSPALLKEAQQLYWAGKLDSAIEKYKEALVSDPKSTEAFVGMARVHLKQEKIQLAIEDLAGGSAVGTASAALETALGELYFRQGKLAEAEKQFIKVVNTGGVDARAYLGLARVRTAISMYQKAKTHIDRAHELQPEDPEIQREWLQTLRRSERIPMLESYLRGATNDDADDRERLTRHLLLLKAMQKQGGGRCHLVNRPGATSMPLHPLLIDANHLHAFGLDVNLNGRGGRLVVDTGSSGILVKRSLAEKAGITKVAESKIEGIGNKHGGTGYYGYAASLRIGDLEFRDCLVEVLETRSVLGDDGLIGPDVFSDYLVQLDFPNQKLKLSELPKRPAEAEEAAIRSGPENKEQEDEAAPRDRYVAPEMRSYTPAFRFGHELLIPAKVGNAPSKLFLIDTGSTVNTISPEAAREVTKVHGDRDVIVEGLSGKVANVFRADKATLQFSHFRQENQDITAFDLSTISKDTGTEVSGILGFTTLRMFEIKIDYRDGLVDFVFDEQRFGR